ncbi:hypothetical protein L3476_26300 [Paenibacillus thiaminolyticus]|uniref:hypothetical protein n=1 Tax=Paenibacillus thiaminolyticus TaxID=49283 RepID=UPI002350545C|nr:hypothetical protein [Paenibacillus thiaminolyticus]WCR26686.1 hypothetical protein L3476_26300 [Paenibacillus thiaminolyticus]
MAMSKTARDEDLKLWAQPAAAAEVVPDADGECLVRYRGQERALRCRTSAPLVARPSRSKRELEWKLQSGGGCSFFVRCCAAVHAEGPCRSRAASSSV